jgi:hypothetical protein
MRFDPWNGQAHGEETMCFHTNYLSSRLATLTEIPQVRGGLIVRDGHYIYKAVHGTGLLVVLGRTAG